jgi:hypothetical protein
MQLRHLAIFLLISGTALASNAKVCKYTGPKGEIQYSQVPLAGKAWSLVECWGDNVKPDAAVQTDEQGKIGVGVSPSSILSQCLDTSLAFA